jgi:lysozyme
MKMALTLLDELARAEGYRSSAYYDTEGYLTIGYGHKISDDRTMSTGIANAQCGAPWSTAKAREHLEVDLKIAERALVKTVLGPLSIADTELPAVVYDVLLELVFNMGASRLLGFKDFLAALKAKRYEAAAFHLLKSKWTFQVGAERAFRIADKVFYA